MKKPKRDKLGRFVSIKKKGKKKNGKTDRRTSKRNGAIKKSVKARHTKRYKHKKSNPHASKLKIREVTAKTWYVHLIFKKITREDYKGEPAGTEEIRNVKRWVPIDRVIGKQRFKENFLPRIIELESESVRKIEEDSHGIFEFQFVKIAKIEPYSFQEEEEDE